MLGKLSTTYVTGFSAEGHREYGQNLLTTFRAYSVAKLDVYTGDMEGVTLKPPPIRHLEQYDIEELVEFLSLWDRNCEVHGQAPVKGWREKEYAAGYSFRFDAYKFCKMVYTMNEAAHRLHAENGPCYMIWLDGDNVVRQPLPPNMAERSLPNGEDFAYLGREPKHTETGYLVFRLPECLPLLNTWAGYYTTGKFKEFKEWHSAYLFDRASEEHPEIKGHNLTPGGRGHVIHQCFVGEYFDHRKGKRKQMKISPEAKR